MESTDGKELVKSGYYYTRAGQCVTLEDWAMGQSGPVFLVCRFYEGEAMEGRMYPSGHTEITMDYEHEGEVEPVNEIFKDVPLFVVDARYKEKSEEVIALCKSIGRLEVLIKNSEREVQKALGKSKEFDLQANAKERTLSGLQEKIQFAEDELLKKTAQISKAEDELGDLTKSVDTPSISKDELGELRKDQFKLRCLEGGGVDNWEWFDESLNDFRERYP